MEGWQMNEVMAASNQVIVYQHLYTYELNTVVNGLKHESLNSPRSINGQRTIRTGQGHYSPAVVSHRSIQDKRYFKKDPYELCFRSRHWNPYSRSDCSMCRIHGPKSVFVCHNYGWSSTPCGDGDHDPR